MGLDIDGQKLTSRGRSGNYGDLKETVKVLESAGCSRFIVTEVSRDGSLSGPNFNLIEQITELTSIPLISSGGVSSLSDIKSLMSLKNGAVEGVIIGKAIYEGVFTLNEAIKSTAI
jgi:phosphoribosylformimino-5-aminoimidazole carboxamide ribonucleotide (ProFAR) isomerase